MGKKKNSLALFEVIDRDRAKGRTDIFTVPQWMEGKDKTPPPGQGSYAPAPAKKAPAPAAEPVDSAAVAPPKPAAAPRVPPRVPLPPVPAARRLAERPVAKQGNRLRVSLTQRHCIAIGVALIVVLAGVFVLGKLAWSPRDGAPAATEGDRNAVPAAAEFGRKPAADRAQAPTPTAGGNAPGPAAGADRTMAAEPERVKGMYYLVIQGLRGMTNEHLRDARRIAEFLRSKGERVTINEFQDQPTQYIVLSLTGFDSPSNDEAKSYVHTIEVLGRSYMAQGGRYNFSQGKDGWFVKW